jgi:hypothetical protein
LDDITPASHAGTEEEEAGAPDTMLLSIATIFALFSLRRDVFGSANRVLRATRRDPQLIDDLRVGFVIAFLPKL